MDHGDIWARVVGCGSGSQWRRFPAASIHRPIRMRHDLLSHGSSAPLGLLDLGLANAFAKCLVFANVFLKPADKIQIHPIDLASMRRFFFFLIL